MGKYNYKDHVENHENEPKIYFLFCILNELAEGNRLKRLELELKSVVKSRGSGYPDIQFPSEEELEDKA